MYVEKVSLITFLAVMFLTPAFVCSEEISIDNVTSQSLLDFSLEVFPNIKTLQLGQDRSIQSGINHLSYKLEAKEYKLFSEALLGSYIAIGMLGLDAVGLLVAVAIDPLVGGIISLVSLTGWSLATLDMAVSYLNLGTSLKKRGEDNTEILLPEISSLLAEAFGFGALTGISLSIVDETGTSLLIASVFSVISSISGIVAIVSTFFYSNEIHYEEYRDMD